MLKKDSPITIREGSLEEVYSVHIRIPEFDGNGSLELYQDRLNGKLHLPLVAEINGELVGFKVGYESDQPKVFYSWMGGIVPGYRNCGIATALADFQDQWTRSQGFKKVFFKTLNRLPPMINFGLQRNFKIMEVIRKESIDEYRIVMMKKL